MSMTYASDVGDWDGDGALGQGVRRHWLFSTHCSSMAFPATYPDVAFAASSCGYYYLQHTTSGSAPPDQELVKAVKQAYFSVLSKLNKKQLQVKNFILPVQLMLLKHIDPFSRQRIIEQMCNYLSLQNRLRSVVLEQAALSLVDLCRLLLALATSGVRKLYLWNALEKCHYPFKGPLKSHIDLDNLTRIPYTLHPGGRKYLKKLKKQKEMNFSQESPTKKEIKSTERFSTACLTYRDSDTFFKNLLEAEIGTIHNAHGTELTTSVSAVYNYDKLLKLMSSDIPDLKDHIISHLDMAIQCDMKRETGRMGTKESNRMTTTQCSYDYYSNTETSAQVLSKIKADLCNEYLKKYENCEIEIEILRDIFKLALNQLTNLTTLSVNYAMLADGTGEALTAVGALARDRLQELELLCQLDELPAAAHGQYDAGANHAIPDAAWTRAKVDCPALKVRFVCVNMMTNDVTKKFLTRSIPLNSLHVDCGFCPTLITPQIAFFSTLKCLHLHYKDTIEHLSIVLWHTSGRIDSSLDNFMRRATRLRTFQYFGPVQYTSTVRQMCLTALRCPRLERFTLMVQGDPCFPEVARDVAAEVRDQLGPRFAERGIHFRLGTHNSSTAQPPPQRPSPETII